MKLQQIRDITFNPDLFYVLGALIGDGCIYNWKTVYHYVILVGDKNFTSKYASKATNCTEIKTKNYIDRSKNIWFVKSNSLPLYLLFKKVREDITYLGQLIDQNSKEFSLEFIEGFFDAEGCVKIIKEKVRKTPKICLDITNTNFEVLDLIRRLLIEELGIEARYSIQKANGIKNKKVAYHLRIYKKEYVQRFFENISTTKLIDEKVSYVENWLKTKNKSTLQLDCSFLRPVSS